MSRSSPSGPTFGSFARRQHRGARLSAVHGAPALIVGGLLALITAAPSFAEGGHGGGGPHQGGPQNAASTDCKGPDCSDQNRSRPAGGGKPGASSGGNQSRSRTVETGGTEGTFADFER
jgi:hypothetical protein